MSDFQQPFQATKADDESTLNENSLLSTPSASQPIITPNNGKEDKEKRRQCNEYNIYNIKLFLASYVAGLYYDSSIVKPQQQYNLSIDNSDAPFIHRIRTRYHEQSSYSEETIIRSMF